MKKFNILFRQVASKLTEFVRRVAVNYTKPTRDFLLEFWTGMLAGQSLVLSDVSRGTGNQALIKKQVEKFGRWLISLFCFHTMIWSYHKIIKSEINDRTIYCIDNTDIAKPYGEKFGSLCQVLDGSKGETEKGYDVINVVALSQNSKQPIPLYTKVFSYIEPGYISNNDETRKALDCINRSFGCGGIKVFDRGFDDSELMRYLIGAGEKFIIRCKKNRSYIFEGKKYNTEDMLGVPAREMKGMFRGILLTYKNYTVEVSSGLSLNLVIVSGLGKEPMTLLTNLPADNDLAQTAGRVYMLRWKVEENHRFEKDIFDLEKFRIRDLQAIRNLVLLAAMLTGFLAVICEHQSHKLFNELYKLSKTIPKKFGKNHFYLYSIARALQYLYQTHATLQYFSSS